MVVNIAAFAGDNVICVYDAELDKYEEKFVETTVQFWEITKVDQYFENVIRVIGKDIDCFYLILNCSYFNEIIKLFIKASTKNGIHDLQIISCHQMDAIISLKYIRAGFDSLLNFIFVPGRIKCVIWKINDCNELSADGYYEEGRTSYQHNVTKDSLQNLKEQIKITPVAPIVVVLCCEQLDSRSTLEQLFNDYQNVHFEPKDFHLYKLLNIIEKQKKKEIIYTVLPILNRVICIKNQGNIKKNNYRLFDSTTYIFLDNYYLLPHKGKFDFEIKQNNMKIKIYEEDILTQTININKKGTTTIRFEVDINGVFNIWLEKKKMSLNFFCFGGISLPNKLKFRNPRKQFLYYQKINAVGIDIGTAECYASVIRTNGPQGVVLDPATCNRSLPSYVDTSDLNTPCGQVVVSRMETKAKSTAFDAKRLIGKERHEVAVDPLWPFEVMSFCEQVYLIFKTEDEEWIKPAAEISASLLSHIKNKIEEFQGVEIKEVAITVPSAFTEKQIDATIDAATCAEILRVHILPEPVAALCAYSYEGLIPNKATVLLYDCGDGTTDICIATITKQHIEVLIDNGNVTLGAKEFDRILIYHFGNILKTIYGVDLQDNKNKYRLMRRCHEIKHTLTVEQEGNLDLDDFIVDHDDVLKITRPEFKAMAADLIIRGKNLIIETMTKAKLHRDKIGIVFLGGGGSRMPMIKEMLKEMFPDVNHYCSKHPEELVANGAALYAYELIVHRILSQHKKRCCL